MYLDMLNKNMYKLRLQKGFTLVEILMALVVFGIIAIGMILPFSQGLHLTKEDRQMIDASSMAKQYLTAVDEKWRLQQNFDIGDLPAITSQYTNNGEFNLVVSTDDIEISDAGNVVIRRVNVQEKSLDGVILAELFMDYNRPGNTMN